MTTVFDPCHLIKRTWPTEAEQLDQKNTGLGPQLIYQTKANVDKPFQLFCHGLTRTQGLYTPRVNTQHKMVSMSEAIFDVPFHSKGIFE